MSQAPVVQYLTRVIPARAAGADGTISLLRVPFAGVVASVAYLAVAAITGNTTESRTLSVVNKLQAGVGTAVAASLAFITGVDAVANKEKAFTLSATAADLVVAEGDILALASAHVGATGLADPGGVVVVKLTRTPTAS